MALIKLGPMVADIRGSIGGTTFARNRGGAYARNRTAPLNPASTRQVAVRAGLAEFSNRWATVLDLAERQAWELYAQNVPLPNSLGESRNLTGQQMYVRSNQLLKDTGFATLDAAPTSFTLGPTITPQFAFDLINNEIDVTGQTGLTLGSPDVGVLIQMSPPQNAGRTFHKSPFRRIYGDEWDAGTTFPFAIDELPYTITAGQAIFIRTANVTADGRVGTPVIQRFLAA